MASQRQHRSFEDAAIDMLSGSASPRSRSATISGWFTHASQAQQQQQQQEASADGDVRAGQWGDTGYVKYLEVTLNQVEKTCRYNGQQQAKYRTELLSLQQKFASHKLHVDASQAQLVQHLTEMSTCQHSVDGLETTMHLFQEELNACEAEKAKLQQRCEEQSRELRTANRQQLQNEKTLQSEESLLAVCLDEKSKLQQRCSELASQLKEKQQCRADFVEWNGERERLRAQYEEQSGELEVTNQLLMAFQDELEACQVYSLSHHAHSIHTQNTSSNASAPSHCVHQCTQTISPNALKSAHQCAQIGSPARSDYLTQCTQISSSCPFRLSETH